MTETIELSTDVLVVGAGGAGMYAAIAAARQGANTLLTDKNMVGRGGATIMAQMTVAAALAEQEADSWEEHCADTISAGRGLCDENLAEIVCRRAPERMREMDEWGVGWARKNGHIAQVLAPGHERRRCCYVDFLNTGPAVSRTLRARVAKVPTIQRVSDVVITELVMHDGVVSGAIGFEGASGTQVSIAAKAVVIATGGLTKLFSRTSASNNMSGEGYALGLRAGAALVDMEFVQFFPIGHLAPRLVGMDPIMWDPFRYKLGGQLLNANNEEFMTAYGHGEEGTYTAPRDRATYAIYKENAAGRGSPHGGAWLSFKHLPEATLRDAFGPVIDRLRTNGIDLCKDAVEVAPIAHYHMGGLAVDKTMQTNVNGLFAAGEAVGGASGANRLSGNAISEALVFGDIAGEHAAKYAFANGSSSSTHTFKPTLAPIRGERGTRRSSVSMMEHLRDVMWRQVGPFRDESGLNAALNDINALKHDATALPVPERQLFANELFDWYELQSALLVAESVARAAVNRQESRGAHQREDYAETSNAFAHHQGVTYKNDTLSVERL